VLVGGEVVVLLATEQLARCLRIRASEQIQCDFRCTRVL
jgi:hypothetical protein